MAATIRVGPYSFTIDGYQWRGDNETIVEYLKLFLKPLGPSGSDPDPDYHVAEVAAKALGGKIIAFDEVPYEEGAVY